MSFLQELTKDLQAKYSKENPLIVNEMKKLELDVIPSGSILIDAVSGIGGLVAKGHVSEVVGANTSGKTTLCLQTAAQAQKMGYNTIYIDSEAVFDIKYAKSLGINTDDKDSFMLVQPTNGEQVIGILEAVDKNLSDKKNKNEHIDLIIIDSVAATRPQEELEGNRRIGLHATLWSKLSYMIKNIALKHKIAFILINQVRFAPDIAPNYGPKGVLESAQESEGSENTTGGEALKYLYSIRWQLKGFSKIMESTENAITGETEEVRIGNISTATTIKNKLSPPMVKTKFAIVYGKGTVDDYILEDIMKAKGFITNQGTYFKYECLNPYLQANPKGNSEGKYPGFIYTKNKFYDWYRTPEIQADVRARFQQMITGSNDIISKADKSDLIEGTSQDTEDVQLEVELD